MNCLTYYNPWFSKLLAYIVEKEDKDYRRQYERSGDNNISNINNNITLSYHT